MLLPAIMVEGSKILIIPLAGTASMEIKLTVYDERAPIIALTAVVLMVVMVLG
jgi:hypothetical protein